MNVAKYWGANEVFYLSTWREMCQEFCLERRSGDKEEEK